jgi:twinkle protein
MIVAASDEKNERSLIDKIMTELRKIVEKTGAGLILVSHLRRLEGNRGHENGAEVNLSHLRGSGGIAQISDCVIALERNQQSSDAKEAQTTRLRVLKSRYTGEVGTAAYLHYDTDSGRLSEVEDFDSEDFAEEPIPF